VAAAVVQMRFFAGLTNEEISAALGISTATVQRHWKMAKAWIYHELAASPHP
jgi:DNA-directed RNA polymerase specialized sigma subunit